MTNSKNLQLLSASDEAVIGKVTYDDFTKSLFDKVLFDDGVFLHETYYCNSQHIIRHIVKDNRNNSSFFEIASENGLVIPALSDENKSFHEMAEFVMKHKYGQSRNFFYLELLKNPRFIRYLDTMQDGSKNPDNRIIWPEGVGEGYNTILKNKFFEKPVPLLDGETKEDKTYLERKVIWELSEPWRNKCYQNAIDKTEKGGGVRRGLLFNEIGAWFGVPKYWEGVSLEDILRTEKYRSSEFHEIHKKSFLIYWSWLNQLHQINFSKKIIGTSINVSDFKFGYDFLGIDNLESKRNDDFEKWTFIWERPNLEFLKNLEATELLKLRNSNSAKEYFEAKMSYEKNPTYSNARDRIKKLQEYSDEICGLKPNINSKVRVYITRFKKIAPLISLLCRGSGHIGEGEELSFLEDIEVIGDVIELFGRALPKNLNSGYELMNPQLDKLELKVKFRSELMIV